MKKENKTDFTVRINNEDDFMVENFSEKEMDTLERFAEYLDLFYRQNLIKKEDDENGEI